MSVLSCLLYAGLVLKRRNGSSLPIGTLSCPNFYYDYYKAAHTSVQDVEAVNVLQREADLHEPVEDEL